VDRYGRPGSYDLTHMAKDFRLTFAFFSPRVRVPNARTEAPAGNATVEVILWP